MKVYSIGKTEFTGRLKHGDLLKKLNELNQAASTKASKLMTNSNNSSNASLNKVLDNPENPTLKDRITISTSGSSTAMGTYSSGLLTTTNAADTWSIFSTIF